MIQVFRLFAFLEGSNEYGISRQERWEVKESEAFADMEEAKDYIRQQSRAHTILPNVLQQWRETKEEHRSLKSEAEVVDDFCFNTEDRYYKEQRYFIGRPDMKKLKQQLKEAGVKVA